MQPPAHPQLDALISLDPGPGLADRRFDPLRPAAGDKVNAVVATEDKHKKQRALRHQVSCCRSLAAALLVAPLALPAHADLKDSFQVHTDKISDAGEFGMDLQVNTTPRGRAAPDYPGEVVPHRGWRFTTGFAYGLATNWEAGLTLPVSRDVGGNTQAAGVKLSLKWLPLNPGEAEAGWFLGANAELARMKQRFSESRSCAELLLMAGWRNADWMLAVNPKFGWPLSDGLRSGTADFSIAAKLVRTVVPDVSVGVELFSELGTTRRILPAGEQGHVLFTTIDAHVGGWDLNFGVGRGLTKSADDLTLKAMVGVPF